ncbi:MAG: hypothetical protein U9Q81_21465 [Pseudomonadota bacterium]|nr:hypothetical protein [Pseudomonadota bacterium]
MIPHVLDYTIPAEHEKLKQDKGEENPVYFVDAVHPQNNPVLACGWITGVKPPGDVGPG